MEDIKQGIIIKVRFEEDDILHINKISSKIQLRKMKLGKSTGIFAGVLFVIILISTLLSNTHTLQSEVPDISANDSSMITNVALAVVFIIVVLISIFILPKKIKKETINNFRNNKDLQNEFEYSISEEKVVAHSITSDTNHDWSYFNKAIETNNVFALFLSDNTAICLPKRCFMNEDDIDILRNIIKDKLQEQKYEYLKVK